MIRSLMQEIARCEKLQAEHTHGTKEWIGAALDISMARSNLAVVLEVRVRVRV